MVDSRVVVDLEMEGRISSVTAITRRDKLATF